MIAAREPSVTAESAWRASLGTRTPENASDPTGVWSLDGDALPIGDGDGPATVLVPSEGVLLLAVDLPIANRAKRLAALPFAIEDRIAEPIDMVHIVAGAELAPRRYLVGVIRHDRMAEWLARADAVGLGDAALVPDALALPVPGEGEWAVDLGATRAVVRAGDGTGFAVPAAMLRTAWDAAGRPRAIGYGAALPEDMAGGEGAALDPPGRLPLASALDLRQGAYARRRRSLPSFGKRLATIAAIGIVAHAGIAAADTLALKRIAAARAEGTRALVARLAPGANVAGDDLPATVADLLPAPGASGGGNALLPVATRLSEALAPLGTGVSARAIGLQGGVVTMDIDAGDPGLAGRIGAALKDAGITAQVTATAAGIRITAPAA